MCGAEGLSLWVIDLEGSFVDTSQFWSSLEQPCSACVNLRGLEQIFPLTHKMENGMRNVITHVILEKHVCMYGIIFIYM